MKTLSLHFFRKLFKWVVLIVLAYAAIHASVPPSVICLLLLAGLDFRLVIHCVDFISAIIRLAAKAAIIILFLSLFL
jgi:D-alanine-D-alanine ligase-like ATP-grasp enzyme